MALTRTIWAFSRSIYYRCHPILRNPTAIYFFHNVWNPPPAAVVLILDKTIIFTQISYHSHTSTKKHSQQTLSDIFSDNSFAILAPEQYLTTD